MRISSWSLIGFFGSCSRTTSGSEPTSVGVATQVEISHVIAPTASDRSLPAPSTTSSAPTPAAPEQETALDAAAQAAALVTADTPISSVKTSLAKPQAQACTTAAVGPWMVAAASVVESADHSTTEDPAPTLKSMRRNGRPPLALRPYWKEKVRQARVNKVPPDELELYYMNLARQTLRQ